MFLLLVRARARARRTGSPSTTSNRTKRGHHGVGTPTCAGLCVAAARRVWWRRWRRWWTWQHRKFHDRDQRGDVRRRPERAGPRAGSRHRLDHRREPDCLPDGDRDQQRHRERHCDAHRRYDRPADHLPETARAARLRHVHRYGHGASLPGCRLLAADFRQPEDHQCHVQRARTHAQCAERDVEFERRSGITVSAGDLQ